MNTTLNNYRKLPGFKLHYLHGKLRIPDLVKKNGFTYEQGGQCENETMEKIVKGFRDHPRKDAAWYAYGRALRKAIFRCILNRIGNRARREHNLDWGHEVALKRVINRSLIPVHNELKKSIFGHQNAETAKFATFIQRIQHLYYPKYLPLGVNPRVFKKYYKTYVQVNNLPAQIIAPKLRACHLNAYGHYATKNKEEREGCKKLNESIK